MGLSTVVDLRTARELEHTGRGPLGTEDITFHHLSVIGDDGGEVVAAPAPPGEDLAERYLWYLDVGRRSLVTALTLIGRPERLPWSSTAPRARTVPVCWPPWSSTSWGGVPDIVADYEITASRMELILGRYRDDPAFAGRMADVPASRFGVEAETMARFLGVLHETMGGGRRWALDAGVGADDLARMEALLLEP